MSAADHEGVYAVNTDGSGLVRLVDTSTQAWISPSGRYFAITHAGNPCVGAVSGGQMRQLPVDHVQAANRRAMAAFSPDEKRVVVRRIDERGTSLVKVDLTTGVVTDISPSQSGDVHSADWSPDGSKLVVGVAGSVVIMDENGSNPTPIWSGSRLVEAALQWSRDGRHVAFVEHGTGNLHLLTIDGATDTALGRTGHYFDWDASGRGVFGSTDGLAVWANGVTTWINKQPPAAPGWTVDGRIMFEEVNASDSTIWTIDADGSNKSVFVHVPYRPNHLVVGGASTATTNAVMVFTTFHAEGPGG